MWSSKEEKLAVFVDSLKVHSVMPCKTQICIYSLNFKTPFEQLQWYIK